MSVIGILTTMTPCSWSRWHGSSSSPPDGSLILVRFSIVVFVYVDCTTWGTSTMIWVMIILMVLVSCRASFLETSTIEAMASSLIAPSSLKAYFLKSLPLHGVVPVLLETEMHLDDQKSSRTIDCQILVR